MLRLRPHHLLCTQAYSGKGYGSEFVKNMNLVTAKLHSEEKTPVEIVFSTDDLCACCPHMLGENLCESNENVNRYDAGVIKHFHIEEKVYIYQDITREIRKKMTPEILKDICGGCSWYPISACRKILAGNVQ